MRLHAVLLSEPLGQLLPLWSATELEQAHKVLVVAISISKKMGFFIGYLLRLHSFIAIDYRFDLPLITGYCSDDGHCL